MPPGVKSHGSCCAWDPFVAQPRLYACNTEKAGSVRQFLLLVASSRDMLKGTSGAVPTRSRCVLLFRPFSAAPSSHQVEPGSERPRRDSQRSSESVSQQRGTLKAHAFLDFVTVLFSTPSIDSLTHSSVALLQRAYRSPPWYPSLSSAVILGNCHALGSNQDHQVQDQPTVGLELEMHVTTHSINVSSSSQSSTHVRSRYV